MQLWRSEICPKIPRSLEEYVDIINSPQWDRFINRNGDNLNVTLIIDVRGDESVVYGDPMFLRDVRTTHFWVDGTFRVCPRKLGNLQLLTIMGTIDGYVSDSYEFVLQVPVFM